METKARLGILDFSDERLHIVKETFKNAQKRKKNVINVLQATGTVQIVDPSNFLRDFDKMIWKPNLALQQTRVLSE